MRAFAAFALVVASVALVGVGCGGDDEDTAEPAPTVTDAVTETDADTTTDDEADGDVANGEQIFASAGCGGCHTLAAAGTNGSVGPNLDDASPSEDKVVERVTEGQGVMPSFKDDLSSQEIADVAAFVSSSVED